MENAVEGLDLEDGEAQGDMQAAKTPLEVTAEDMADEDWGPVKGKKGKKGKGKNVKAEVENDEQPGSYQLHSAHLGSADLWMSIAALHESGSPSAAPQVEDGEDETKEPDLKILSKKEKEKLKKEREKVSFRVSCYDIYISPTFRILSGKEEGSEENRG